MFATLTASGHTVTYVYGIEKLDNNGNRKSFTTKDTYTAATKGVTHHRAKCSVCGLYLDNDYVKHSYTEYVNVQYKSGSTTYPGYNIFEAKCECGVVAAPAEVSGEGSPANLRNALKDAAARGIPVVHIVAPYWQVKNQNGTPANGIHIDFPSAGSGAIKVLLKVKFILKQSMESAVSLNVPLIAEISEAKNWQECK